MALPAALHLINIMAAAMRPVLVLEPASATAASSQHPQLEEELHQTSGSGYGHVDVCRSSAANFGSSNGDVGRGQFKEVEEGCALYAGQGLRRCEPLRDDGEDDVKSDDDADDIEGQLCIQCCILLIDGPDLRREGTL